MQDTFFEGATFREVTLSSGEVCAFPIRYYDATEIVATFPVSIARVRDLLPTPRLCPVQVVPGKSAVTFAALEYRACDLAPYNEVGILVPVRYAPRIDVPLLPLLFRDRFAGYGYYIHRLPVTTQQALDAGVEALGAPKFLSSITFSDTRSSRSCRLTADGKEIVTFEVEKLPAHPRREAMWMYTVKDGSLVRWRFETQGLFGVGLFRGGASFTLGDHPIADELRRLKPGRIALQRTYAPRIQAMLHLPVGHYPLGQAQPRRAILAGR